MKVFVAVNLDTGWDCIVGVFDTKEKAEAACRPTAEELEEDEEWYMSRVGDDGLYDLHHIFEKEVH